jgi:hypothetical protein
MQDEIVTAVSTKMAAVCWVAALCPLVSVYQFR